MVGGERAIYEPIKPILDAFGDKVYYAGDIGAGTVCKLVHNMIGQGIRQAIAEGLMLGVKAGVEPQALWECVRGSGADERPARGTTAASVPRAIRTGQLCAGPVRQRHRPDDGLGREYDVPMPVANFAEHIAFEAMNRGWGDKDSSVTFLLQEEAAGVEVRAPEVDPGKAAKFIAAHPDAE
jgi:3-hydroxyisobutyrate dehydrogenase